MIKDDHYIANAQNAHIDTSSFERDILDQLSQSDDNTTDEIFEKIYDLAFSMTKMTPEQLPDAQLICRYLSPTKFLKFLDTRHINFPMATQFTDQWECRIPEDYDNAVLRVLKSLRLQGDVWYNLVKMKAAEWRISCWIQLDDYFDDHLMWDSYAGGSQGVGVTVRYGALKDALVKSAAQHDIDGTLQSGKVSYEALSLLPFNKHHIFRNEKEVRFAFRAFQPSAKSVSINEIFCLFGVRISPAATQEHHDMIRKLWIRYGGEDRIQWPQ